MHPALRYVLVAVTPILYSLGFMSHLTLAQPSVGRNNSIVYAHIGNAGEIVPMSHHQMMITDIGGLDRSGGHIVITDFSGRLIWQYTGNLDIPHAAYPMPNGDVIISDAGDDRVIIVNRRSKIVWDTDNLGKGRGRLGQGTLSDGSRILYPNDAKPLADGDIMISCRLQNRVVIVTRQGKIVQDIHGMLNRQHNPEPLPNGDTLIPDSGNNRLLEINKQNQIVWSYGGKDSNGDWLLAWPRDANVLPNGDILVTDSDHNRLVELTRAGATVREWTDLPRPYSAASLPNGNILVGDGGSYGVVELNQQDHIVWHLNHPSKGGGSPQPTTVRNGNFENVERGTNSILSYWARNDALAYSTPPGKRVDMVRDTNQWHAGHASARITYHGDSNGISFGQTIAVQAGHEYEFSGWIKTQDVEPCSPCVYGPGDRPGHSAEFEFGYGVAHGAAPAAPALPQHQGTSGWIHDDMKFTVPYGAKSLTMQLMLRGQGTVWFDSVWVSKLN